MLLNKPELLDVRDSKVGGFTPSNRQRIRTRECANCNVK